jgi:hypothetical protein
MYALDKMKVVQLLAELLGYDQASKDEYKQLKSCFQLVKRENEANRKSAIKQRLKFYNKFPMHLL